jgi:hypothetical protein
MDRNQHQSEKVAGAAGHIRNRVQQGPQQNQAIELADCRTHQYDTPTVAEMKIVCAFGCRISRSRQPARQRTVLAPEVSCTAHRCCVIQRVQPQQRATPDAPVHDADIREHTGERHDDHGNAVQQRGAPPQNAVLFSPRHPHQADRLHRDHAGHHHRADAAAEKPFSRSDWSATSETRGRR